MTYLDAVLLGIVEGLTEFLPISSTGHLILASSALKIPDTDAMKAFEVIIQAGAIAAVLWHYRDYLSQLILRVFRREPQALHMMNLLLIAFLPAAVMGLALQRLIKAHLFGVGPVVGALIVGGILMIVIERFMQKKEAKIPALEKASRKSALIIGISQCLAMWPGTSRSMATILGGRIAGYSTRQAAEFSFLLAIPTLMGAAVVDVYKHRDQMAAANDAILLLIGLIVSFITALIVIRGFLHFLKNHSMEVFGWYRILFGLALIAYHISNS